MISFNLSKGFIGKLSELEQQAWESRSMDTVVGLRNVCECLSAGFVINTDIEVEELERIVLFSHTENYKNEIDRVLHSALKLDLLSPTKLNADLIRNQDVYLLDFDVNIPFQNGVISFSEPFDFVKKLKSWKSFSKEVKKHQSYEKILTTPSNAMVIIDPYLIQTKKFDKFFSFLENFYSKRLSIKFHLTIYSNIDEGGSEKPVMDMVMRLDKFVNLEYEIILVNNIFTSNRVFVSNYNMGFFAHPFDRDDIISVSFLPAEIGGLEIAKSYVSQFVKQANYFAMKQSTVQKIYRNNSQFSNRLVSEFCPI
jgi:hypothetical protein